MQYDVRGAYDRAKLFTWTKTADDILEKVHRKGISNTVH